LKGCLNEEANAEWEQRQLCGAITHSSLITQHSHFQPMQTRPLGNTPFSLPVLSFGPSLGQEFFVQGDLGEVAEERAASPRPWITSSILAIYRGAGCQKFALAVALKDVPRDSYLLCCQARTLKRRALRLSARLVVESRRHQLWKDGRRSPRSCLPTTSVVDIGISSRRWPALRKVQHRGR